MKKLDRLPLRRALISVYDKTNLAEFARGLHEAGVKLVSTGSTASTIAAAGVPVTEVTEVTEFPECLEGRVKTLHPRIHAGILADRRKQEHIDTLNELDVEPFDLVVVNLYPFAETVASGADQDAIIEKIDIGGPSMVRAAAKNHDAVAIVVDPKDYERTVTAAQDGGFSLEERRRLAAGAFAHTAAYDTAVATWTAAQFQQDEDANFWPPYAGLGFERSETLRYGENPHQRAALYVDPAAAPGIAQAEQIHGKAMSYNNYVDADAALRAAYDFNEPAVAIIKHNNPCGIAIASPDAADPIADAYAKAHACDPLSAYGGVIAANRPVTKDMAQAVKDIFTEVIVAPGYESEALEILETKKNLRLLVLPDGFGRNAEGDNPKNWQLVAGEPADEATLRDLEFAWRALRAPKSNAIMLADNGAAVGIGMGQVNRVDSCKLSVERANTLGGEDQERARGAVAASDAFFPFADGLQVLLDAGIRAVVHPGGSSRDDEVIQAAKDAGVTMYLTGTRHFFH